MKVKNIIFTGVELLLNIVIIFSTVYILRSYMIAPFQVFGPSMCDTLNYSEDKCVRNFGEYIIVNKVTVHSYFGEYIQTDLKRGDIIVFHPPHNKKDFFIKRVIGLPGETIKFKDQKVHIINEKGEFTLHEPYVGKENNSKTFPLNNNFSTFNIPNDKYFVMGDNRRQSSDSRSCFRAYYNGACAHSNTPFIGLDLIEGKAWYVLWPFNKFRKLEKADYEI